MTNTTLLLRLSEISELARSNLHGQPLRVAAVMSDEYAYDTDVVQNLDGTVSFKESFAVELLRALEITMNFTTIPVITKFWGHLLPNNTWVGMIALLLDNKTDLGLSSIADRPFRRAVVDFNIPTNEIRLAAYFQRPPAVSSHFSALIKPFQPICWYAVLCMVLGMTFTAIIVNNVLLDQDHNPDIPDSLQFESSSQKKIELNCSQTMTSWIKAWAVSSRKGRNKLSSAGIGRDHWNVSDCFMWSMTAMSLRGFYKLPIESSLRIVMIVGSLAGIVLFAAYSGTLVSFLSVVIDPINNIGQLLATDFTFVVVDYELPLKFLSESPDAKGVMLFKRRRTDKSYPSMKEAREEMNRGRFVFVTDHAGAYESLTTDFSTLEACRIREIEVENGRQKQGTLVQRNSPYKRIIDYQILKTVQFGLVSRWSKKFLKKKSVCEDASEYEGVEIGSSSLAFSILLGFGWIAGWAGLLFEVWSRRRINQSNNCANEGFVL